MHIDGMKTTPLMQHIYAPFGRRAAAALLDNLVFSPLLLWYFVPKADRHLLVLALSITMVVSQIFEGVKGYSFGRYITRTRVIDMHTGKHLGIVRDFVRTQLHAIELVVLPISFLRPLWNKYSLTFGDEIMATCVTYVPKQERGWTPIPATERATQPAAPALPDAA
jgi:uncharacterized RDD family membrane protein YckC